MQYLHYYYFILQVPNGTLPMQLCGRPFCIFLCRGRFHGKEWCDGPQPPRGVLHTCPVPPPPPHRPPSTGSHPGKMTPMWPWLRLHMKRIQMGGLLIDLCGFFCQVLFMFIFYKHSCSIRKIDAQLQQFVQLPCFLLNIWWNPALRMQFESTLTFAFPVLGFLE